MRFHWPGLNGTSWSVHSESARRSRYKKSIGDAHQRSPVEPRVEGGRIESGQESAKIIHSGDTASIGEGDDNTIWVLVHDPERRPRGRDPGVFVELGEVHYEQNGLIRVADRRVARDSLQRLIVELTGVDTHIDFEAPERSRIPEGRYAAIEVEHVDEHYRVTAAGRATRYLKDLPQPAEDDEDGRWLVMAGEESILRRALVNAIMPVHSHLVWQASRHGHELLMGIGIVSAVLSFVSAFFAPVAVVAAVGLGVFRWKQSDIVAITHRHFVHPYIDRTLADLCVPDKATAKMTIAPTSISRT